MKYTRLPSPALAAIVLMLFQSALLAVERPNPGVGEFETATLEPKDKQRHPISVGKHEYLGLDRKEDGSPEPGQHLPVLDILAGGEITVIDNGVIERPWSSKSFEKKGRVQLVQYIAASRVAARQNKQFNDTLIEKRYSSEKLDTTVIVHMADTSSFAKGFVVNRMAKNKVKHEKINFVIDTDGVGMQRWGMKHESFAVIVLDANGKVLFAKDGPLSEIEIETTIKLIEGLMI